MEIFQNGRFSTGEPVYQIGTKNTDGTYTVVVFDLMSRAQAEAKLESMGGGKKTVSKEPEKAEVPNYSSMTKNELELLMRKYGIELDRRKSKADLLEEVAAFFKGDWALS